MTTRRSNRGVPIDLDAMISSSQSSPAVGNMRVNAAGDLLGPGGEILQKSEDRVRGYYKNNPRSSTVQTSLKGNSNAKLTPDFASTPSSDQLNTANTAKENVRTAKPKPTNKTVETQPSEFDAPQEPIGYREVALPNGDIEMVPVFKSETDEQ